MQKRNTTPEIRDKGHGSQERLDRYGKMILSTSKTGTVGLFTWLVLCK